MPGSKFSGLQKLVALSVITLIALIAVSQINTFSPGDADGTATGSAVNIGTYSGNGGSAFSDACQAPATEEDAAKCAKDEPGGLAALIGHEKIAINFTWLLIAGAFVLFMQAGFALLTTGLTRAKNAGHMMMLNFAAFVIAWVGYFTVGFAFQFGGAAINAAPGNLGGAMVLGHLLKVSGSHWGLIGLNGFFLQSGHSYDVGALALFFFEVVFMETAGYIIVGAIAERINFKTFIVAELLLGAIIYPIYGNWLWGGGWLSQIGHSWNLGHGAVDFAGSGVVHGTGGWIALALAVLIETARPTPSLDIASPSSSPALSSSYSVGWGSTRAQRLAPPICASQSSLRTQLRPRFSAPWPRWRSPRSSTESRTSRCPATACLRDWWRSQPPAPSSRHGLPPSSVSPLASSSAAASGSGTTSRRWTTPAAQSRSTGSAAPGA